MNLPASRTSIICFALISAVSGGCGPERGSTTASTYGKLSWYDTDQVHEQFPEKIQDLVAASVLLARRDKALGESGFCSGGLVSYRGENFLFTAGHCLRTQADCENTFLIPDYEFFGGRQRQDHTIYKCTELLERYVYDDHIDEPPTNPNANAQTRDVDYAIARYELVSVAEGQEEVTPFPLVFRYVRAYEGLIAAGHPSNLDDELVQEIKQKKTKNWGELQYLNSGYTYAKKTVFDCSSYVITPTAMTHDCDTRQGFSGALLFTYPDAVFAGIHYHGGKYFDGDESVDPQLLNRAVGAAFIKRTLDRIIAASSLNSTQP